MEGPYTTLIGFIGFASGMIGLILFMPISPDFGVNAALGTAAGMACGALGRRIGAIVDKRHAK